MNDNVLAPASSIVRNPHLLSTAVGDELVLMSVAAGKYYGLNVVAADIWQRLEPGVSLSAVCSSLSDKYDAGAQIIERDVQRLIRELRSHKLIEVDSCRTPSTR